MRDFTWKNLILTIAAVCMVIYSAVFFFSGCVAAKNEREQRTTQIARH